MLFRRPNHPPRKNEAGSHDSVFHIWLNPVSGRLDTPVVLVDDHNNLYFLNRPMGD